MAEERKIPNTPTEPMKPAATAPAKSEAEKDPAEPGKPAAVEVKQIDGASFL